MSLRVIALVREAEASRLPEGPWGLRCVRAAGIAAVVREVSGADGRSAATVNEAALREHDALVRRVAELVEAVLPVRFGTWVDGERALDRALGPHEAELASALDEVAGREQMTLRLFARPRALPSVVDEPGDEQLGPGARYLIARQRAARRAASLPELVPLRDALARLVVAERVQLSPQSRSDETSATATATATAIATATATETPPDVALVASVSHLIPRGGAGEYREAIARVVLPPPARVVASGPWPPYAFAPETLS